MKTSRTKKTQPGVIQEKQWKTAEKIEKVSRNVGSSTLVENWLSDRLKSEGTQMEWMNNNLLINETEVNMKKSFFEKTKRGRSG